MQPTEPTQAQQQPQWQAVTRPLTGAEWAAMGRRYLGAITHGIPRDIWASILDTTHNTRTFLKQPPRWFIVALVLATIGLDLFGALAWTGAVRSQAAYLRSLMP